MKGHLDAEQLKSIRYEELQALAKDMGVSAGGKKEEIIARIAAVEVDVPEKEELTEEEKAEAEAAQQEEVRAAAEQEAKEQEAKEQEEAERTAKEVKEKAADEQKGREEAGLVTVKTITRFLDKQLNQIKEAGEVYRGSMERAAELEAAGVADIIR